MDNISGRDESRSSERGRDWTGRGGTGRRGTGGSGTRSGSRRRGTGRPWRRSTGTLNCP